MAISFNLLDLPSHWTDMNSLTVIEASNLLNQFKMYLAMILQGNFTQELRCNVNQMLPIVKKLVSKTNSGKHMTIAPPPMMGGGWVLNSVNPLDMLFEDPYGMNESIVNTAIDIIDLTIGSVKMLGTNNSLIFPKKDNNMECNNKVFIVHGRDSLAKEQCARFILQLGLEPIILSEQSNNGNTIIEKFEDNANVGYAVVLFTADDEGYLKGDNIVSGRARQNVIFELGYFVGKMGRGKVSILYKMGVEIPSDLSGIAYTVMDDNLSWRLALAKELKGAGYVIDLNKVFS